MAWSCPSLIRAAPRWFPVAYLVVGLAAAACVVERVPSTETSKAVDPTAGLGTLDADVGAAVSPFPAITPSPEADTIEPPPAGTVAPPPSPASRVPTPTRPKVQSIPDPLAPTETPPPLLGGRPLTFENQPAIPSLDLFDLALRLGRIASGTAYAPLPRQSVGDSVTFWALDLNQDLMFQVDAMLRHSTRYADLYAEIGSNLSDQLLVEAGRVFDEDIYPTVLSTFRRPDADQPFGPIALLHLALPAAAGYYDPTDEYPPEIYPFSNQRRLVYLNTAYADPSSPLYVGLVAHEFQHAVHRATDPDEEGWINEGLSVLANLLFDDGEVFLNAYIHRYDDQLNAWTAGIGTAADYGSAGLLMHYLLLHYPDAAGGLGAFVARQEDGFEGIDAYLREQGYGLSWRDLLAEWGAANYLDTKSSWDPYPERQVSLSPTRSVRDVGEFEQRDAPQFAPYYVALDLPHDDDYLLRFNGADLSRLIPKADGEPVGSWWSGGGDATDATLTRTFDLTDARGAEMTLRLWHEIEETWDFAYVVISADGGESWQPVVGPSMVAESENPIGQAFGPGYTGMSGGGSSAKWIDETIDLSEYDGLVVQVRIEYVTDGAVNLTGFALAGAFLPAIDYSWDASDGRGAWETDGFFFGNGTVGQEFEVRLLLVRSDGRHEIIPFDLNQRNVGSVELRGLGEQYVEAALMVMPMAPATRQPATFDVSVERLPG